MKVLYRPEQVGAIAGVQLGVNAGCCSIRRGPQAGCLLANVGLSPCEAPQVRRVLHV